MIRQIKTTRKKVNYTVYLAGGLTSWSDLTATTAGEKINCTVVVVGFSDVIIIISRSKGFNKHQRSLCQASFQVLKQGSTLVNAGATPNGFSSATSGIYSLFLLYLLSLTLKM